MKRIISLLLAVVFITSFATVASAHTMYAPDGRTANVKDSEISKWEAVGWYRNKADVTKTLYAPDGRTITVWKSQVNSYLSVGWYDYPVIKMYALDGRTAVFAASAAPAQNKVGWYYSPVVRLYAPDGRTTIVAEKEMNAYLNVGWYAYPVIKMYALDGRTCVVRTNEADAYNKVGWYYSPVVRLYSSDGRTIVVPTWEKNAYLNVGWSETINQSSKSNSRAGIDFIGKKLSDAIAMFGDDYSVSSLGGSYKIEFDSMPAYEFYISLYGSLALKDREITDVFVEQSGNATSKIVVNMTKSAIESILGYQLTMYRYTYDGMYGGDFPTGDYYAHIIIGDKVIIMDFSYYNGEYISEYALIRTCESYFGSDYPY